MSVDWNVLKTDYVVHGELSLAALAKKYEVYRVVCETAEREHWKEERELHASRFSTKLWPPARKPGRPEMVLPVQPAVLSTGPAPTTSTCSDSSSASSALIEDAEFSGLTIPK